MLIRYPGSKAKLADAIISLFPDEFRYPLWGTSQSYVEPFFGAGAIGFEVLKIIPRTASVFLNDLDIGIVSLWRTVLRDPKGLQRLISNFRPTAESFYEFKASDGDISGGELSCGFRKLAVHQMSVSGFGVMSGGPLGGRDQRNAAYPVDCRWNAERLQKHVAESHKMLRKFANVEFSHGDFEPLIRASGEGAFIYADPPYVKAGPALYKHSMAEDDHRRLARCVRDSSAQWAVSYDEHPLVEEMFSGCTITPIAARYSNAVARNGERPKNREVVITP